MNINMFDLIRERCEENGVEFALHFDELNDLVVVWFKKGDWSNQYALNMYLSLDILMQRITKRLDEFLKDVERSEGEADDVS